MLKNYTKFLVLSTIMLVVGNNSNNCYSIEEDMDVEVENIYTDEYGIQHDRNGHAIPDRDDAGNIIENEHFLVENYIRSTYFDTLKETKRIFKNIGLENMYDMLYDVFTIAYHIDSFIPKELTELQFQCNFFNDISNGFITLNIDNITLKQFSYYLQNKCFNLAIELMNKIQYLINNNNNLNTDKLKHQISYNIAQYFFTMQQLTKYLKEFVLHKDNILHINDNLKNNIVNNIEFSQNILNKLSTKYNMEYYKYLEELPHDDNGNIIENEAFLNSNHFSNTCNNILQCLRNTIKNEYPQTHSELIRDFIVQYNNMIHHIEGFTYNSIDYPDYFSYDSNITWQCDYLNQQLPSIFNLNTQINKSLDCLQLLQYFANKITIKLINMANNIQIQTMEHVKNPNKYLARYDINRIIDNNISNCINEIKAMASSMVDFLKNDTKFKKALPNLELQQILINSIEKCIPLLDIKKWKSNRLLH